MIRFSRGNFTFVRLSFRKFVGLFPRRIGTAATRNFPSSVFGSRQPSLWNFGPKLSLWSARVSHGCATGSEGRERVEPEATGRTELNATQSRPREGKRTKPDSGGHADTPFTSDIHAPRLHNTYVALYFTSQ